MGRPASGPSGSAPVRAPGWPPAPPAGRPGPAGRRRAGIPRGWCGAPPSWPTCPWRCAPLLSAGPGRCPAGTATCAEAEPLSSIQASPAPPRGCVCLGVSHLLGPDGVPEQQPPNDLEYAHHHEPDTQQEGQDVDRGGGRDRHGDSRDEACRAEYDPPGAALTDPAGDPPDERGESLDYPGDADDQADECPGQVQMPDQNDADDDEKQPGDAQPDPVRLGRVEDPDQVEDT